MPPTPQPTTPSPFTIVVCESVPTSVSGNACSTPSRVSRQTTRARYSRFTWWTIPVSGGTTRKLLEGVLAPPQEDVALAVALVLEAAVQIERVALAEVIHLHGVIDDELDRLQRVDLLRVASERDDAVAHGREIDDRRHAGEVLEQHARRSEGNLLLAGAPADPSSRASRCRRFLTNAPSSVRRRFSSRMRSEYGRRETCGKPARSSAGRLAYWSVSAPDTSVVRAPKELSVGMGQLDVSSRRTSACGAARPQA